MALTLLPAPGKGKPVAIGLALFALAIVYLLLFHGFITQHLAYAAEISDLKDAELRFRQIAAQRPQIESRLAEVRQFQAGANYYVSPNMRIMADVVVPIDARKHPGPAALMRLQMQF